MRKIAIALSLLLITAGALATESGRRAHDGGFKEVESLAALPSPILKSLGALAAGFDGVADKGERFNATDFVDRSIPRRRFLVGGRSGDIWLVALEHGGRGYSVQTYLYSGEGELRQHRVLSGRPASFQAVLDAALAKQPLE